MENEKYLFVVSGPSGVGKDTVISHLRSTHPEIGGRGQLLLPDGRAV